MSSDDHFQRTLDQINQNQRIAASLDAVAAFQTFNDQIQNQINASKVLNESQLFKDSKKIAEQIQITLAPIQLIGQSLQESFVHASSAFKASFPLSELGLINPLQVLPAQFKTGIDSTLDEFLKVHTTFNNISDLLKGLPSEDEQKKEIRSSLTIFIRNGWYASVDMTLSEIHETAKSFENGDYDSADNFLIKFYEKAAEEIIDSACLLFPGRAQLLKKAYLAHDKGDYDLAILVLLSQSDGIGYDLFENSLYTRHSRKKKRIRSQLSFPTSDYFLSIFFAQALRNSPLNANTKKLGKARKPLNRHAVMHGLSTDYGTKINSLRAISWLQQVLSLKEKRRTVKKDSRSTGKKPSKPKPTRKPKANP